MWSWSPYRQITDFNPRFPRGKRHTILPSAAGEGYFNPRFPRGKRPCSSAFCPKLHDFNPRFPRGKRLSVSAISLWDSFLFQSTLPAGEATKAIFTRSLDSQFQSTLPAGEATCRHLCRHCRQDFNPRFPRGKRPNVLDVMSVAFAFQSTLPAGEATSRLTRCGPMPSYFNPRFPRGKRQHPPRQIAEEIVISIHASRGGSDIIRDYFRASPIAISIHASRGGSDRVAWVCRKVWNISIHASRGGSDFNVGAIFIGSRDFNPRFPRGKRLPGPARLSCWILYFNPRFPRGKRQISQVLLTRIAGFQSTLPAGEATTGGGRP